MSISTSITCTCGVVGYLNDFSSYEWWQSQYIERRRLSETSCRKLELIEFYESAKLPVYMHKKKEEAQPLIRSLRSALQELNGS